MSFFGKWLESLTPEYTVNKTCVREISPRATCSACIDICEPNALSIAKNHKLVFDSTKCTSCHECVVACPNHSISGIPYTKQIEHQELRINEEQVLQIKELLILKSIGIHTLTAEKSLSNEWKQVIESTNAQLAIYGQEPFQVVENYNKMEKEVDRRQLFQMFKADSLQYSKQFLPIKWRDNPELWNFHTHYPNHQQFQIQIDKETCNNCTICFKICPNHVFTIHQEYYEISHGNCTDCKLCIDVCMKNSITIEPSIQEKQTTKLLKYNHTCTHCKKNFETWSESETQCPSCQKYFNPTSSYKVRI